MGGTVFGLQRRKRMAFREKFGGAKLGRLKEGLGRSKKTHFRNKRRKLDGANACLDRTSVSGSRFLQKTAKHSLGAAKQGRSAANQCILAKKIKTTLQKGMGGSVLGPHRRERIMFLGKFGDARLGRLKKGLGRNNKAHFCEKDAKLGEAKTYLDRTGASGSPFLRSYANHRTPAGNHIKADGKA